MTRGRIPPLIRAIRATAMPPGGKREGAGRPASRGVRKQLLSVRITPELREFLQEQEDSAANTIEDAIRRTAAFREWKKARES